MRYLLNGYCFTLFLTLILSGCASTDTVVFVTKTSFGIDFDTKPATVSVAYDRIEGYFGPRYSNGAIPPVIAEIKTDGKIFNPRIRQIYASGDAAEIIAGSTKIPEALPLEGDKKAMFFGTTTTTGLKVGFTSNVPDSFTFGYKRKEMSVIPLGNKGSKDVYPSVLATIDTGTNIGSPQETSLNTGQFFATGAAAIALSSNIKLAQLLETGSVTDSLVIFEKEPNGELIEAWVRKDIPANKDALRVWLNTNGLTDIGITSFNTGTMYKEKRIDAIKALNIN